MKRADTIIKWNQLFVECSNSEIDLLVLKRFTNEIFERLKGIYTYKYFIYLTMEQNKTNF